MASRRRRRSIYDPWVEESNLLALVAERGFAVPRTDDQDRAARSLYKQGMLEWKVTVGGDKAVVLTRSGEKHIGRALQAGTGNHRNPQSKTHSKKASAALRLAQVHLDAAKKRHPVFRWLGPTEVDPSQHGRGTKEDTVNHAVDAVRWSGVAIQETEYMKDGMERMRIYGEATGAGIDALKILKRLSNVSTNPVPGLPGGSMSACMEIVDRPGVVSPAAVCQAIKQKRGLTETAGLRIPTKRRKTSPALRRLMRGT
jgi:hypothetical protein